MPDAASSLAEAESTFAAHSVREGMRAAFLAHFAPNGLFVRAGWKVAREWLEARPDPPILLEWKPVHVEAAASGEMGLSTGPWRLTPKSPPGAAPSFGQFVSVWKRDAGGRWQVGVDLGISHAEPALWDAPLRATNLAPTRSTDSLEAIEQAFVREWSAAGPAAAYRSHAAERVRLYRTGAAPALGRASALVVAGDARDTRWEIERVEAARSGDFGYAMGHYTVAGKTAGHYVRVWHVEGGRWRIVLDVIQAGTP
jgi:ketosteroid isomerase-like protein